MRRLLRHRAVTAAGATVLLVAAAVGGVGLVDSSASTVGASCTSFPEVSQGADSQTVTVTCDVPNPPPVTVTATATTTETATATATVTATQTVTATPAPASSATPTAPAYNYGGTSGWGAPTAVNLTTEPLGTTYTPGVRTSTDQTYNRKSQAVFGPNGLTITAERACSTCTIYSADVMMRGVTVPAEFAVEADIEMQGTGPGMGHAFWFRPISGDGEIDGLEYIGSNAGKGIAGGPGNFESKATLIRTGSNPYNQGSKAFGIPPLAGGGYNGVRHYRAELTTSQFSEWVDGVLVGTITKTQFENANGAGSWSQFAAGTRWYPRLTLQAGNGTSAKLWGTVPASFSKATIRLGALRIFPRA